jgi:putative DNA primase/helicase
VSKLPFDPEEIALAAIADAKRPIIRLKAGFLDLLATEAERILIKSGMPIYQRGRSLVRPIRAEVPASRSRTTLAAGLANLSIASLVDRMCQAAIWEKFDGRAKDWVRVDPPEKLASIVMSRVGDWVFPVIAGVITTPTLRPDGTLLTDPGYDIATRLYHVVDNALDIHKHLPKEFTLEAAKNALADLQYIIKGFPFVTDVDQSVALSALISPVIRGALPVVPMHAFRASTAGTGKTFLVDVISAISTGRPCPVATVAKDEAETEKRLTGLLLAAFPVVCLDNVNGELGGDLLCQAIERPVVQVRPLGGSDIIEIESRATIFATGNALRVRGDMTRRSLIANLDAGVERPELREFEFDPVEMVLSDRARYVAAVLTIVVAHARAKFPGKPAIGLASFNEWSDYVRSALIWLGCADPCASMDEAREDDPELTELIELLTVWKEEIGYLTVTSAEIISMISEKEYEDEENSWKYPGMREIITRVGMNRTGVDSKKIGYFLKSKSGRIVQGLKMKKVGTTKNGMVKWQVVGV